MPGFIDAIADFFGGIGAENLGTAAVFVILSICAFVNGLRKARIRQPSTVDDPLPKRLERIEIEHAHLEDRQALAEARIARVEGQVGVLQTLIVGRAKDSRAY